MAKVRYKVRKVRLPNGRIVHQRVAMGGVEDWFGGDAVTLTDVMDGRFVDRMEQVQCIDKANADSRVQRIDAKIAQLAHWNPLPTVSVTDLSIVVTTLTSAINEARASVSGAPRSTSDAQSAINGSLADLRTWGDERINAWNAAIVKARSTGVSVIDVPDLKRSTMKILAHVSNAFMVTAFLECRVTMLDRAAAVIDRAVAVVSQIVGVVVDAGIAVVKAATAPLNLISWLGKHPYIPIGIGAILLFKRYGMKV